MMILKKIKNLIQENRKLHNTNLSQIKELEWAHVYHDSIRGKDWLENTPLNIGRWAGNYAFFYVLNRILNDCKPLSILEFGLGESSKFITAYLNNELKTTSHLIIEQDSNWHSTFLENNKLNSKSTIKICPLVKKNIKGYEVSSYKDLENNVTGKYDLYLIDGPFGSEHFSRYDFIEIAKGFNSNDQFIIVIDDYERIGEQETVKDLLNMLKEKGLSIYFGTYTGNKSVCVLATERYKYLRSL